MQISRGRILPFFNEIFDGLCKLAADPDLNVKNGAQLLDRLMKDIVIESNVFEVEKFIPLLRVRTQSFGTHVHAHTCTHDIGHSTRIHEHSRFTAHYASYIRPSTLNTTNPTLLSAYTPLMRMARTVCTW